MSDARDTKVPHHVDDEPFLERWSRRKRQAREGVDDEATTSPAPAPEEAGPEPAGTANVPDLPDIESLGEDSDYSAFMGPGVDESMRRKALRKLFSSPKFNVCDGLDDYCDDFTQWAPLGDIVTADMRHHLERAARLAEKLGEAVDSRHEGDAVPGAAAVASTEPAARDEAGPAEPGDDEKERDA